MSFLRQGVSIASARVFGREDIPQGDDDELRVLRTVFDVVGDDGDVAEVKSGIDLVHKVQGCGLIV